jgi:hypothetical protein
MSSPGTRHLPPLEPAESFSEFQRNFANQPSEELAKSHRYARSLWKVRRDLNLSEMRLKPTRRDDPQGE